VAAQRYLVKAITEGWTSQAVLGEINETILESPKWEKFDFGLSSSATAVGDEPNSNEIVESLDDVVVGVEEVADAAPAVETRKEAAV
jgi:hypothetical protein